MKDKIILLAAILVGVLAFVFTSSYLRGERDKLYKGARKVPVIVAKRELTAGTILSAQDLALSEVFERTVGANVLREDDYQNVLNKKLRYSVKRGQPLDLSYVDMPLSGRHGLAPMIRNGMRAVSISVGGDAAVSGLVQPNDQVDIIGTFSFPSRKVPGEMETVTLTVLQDVSILATGQRLAKDAVWSGEQATGRRSSGYSTVTLEVTPREGELLIFAQHVKGQLALALRHPEDISFEKDLPEINFEHLENKLPELNTYRQRYIRNKKDL